MAVRSVAARSHTSPADAVVPACLNLAQPQPTAKSQAQRRIGFPMRVSEIESLTQPLGINKTHPFEFNEWYHCSICDSFSQTSSQAQPEA